MSLQGIVKGGQWGVGKFFTSRPSEIPAEFDVADLKIKELHQQLVELNRAIRRYLKSLSVYTASAVSEANQFQEFAASLAESGIGNVCAVILNKLNEAILASSVAQNDLKEKVESCLIMNVESYMQEVITPARESKRQWQHARVEFEASLVKVEQFLKTVMTQFTPSKLYLLQTLSRRALLTEQQKFDFAADSLGDTLWFRDFRVFLYQAEMMMELHDQALSTYSQYFEIGDFLSALRTEVESKRVRFNQRKEEQQLARQHEEDEAYFTRYDTLVELLSADDLALVNAVSLTAGSEQNEILSSVIKILDAHKKTMPIINLAICDEVASTKAASTLFRGNSVSTKLISAFTRMTGTKYLDIIKNLILDVADDPKGYEVDPAKAAEGVNVAANLGKLKTMTKRFVDAIVGSVSVCPIPFKEISCKLRTEVTSRFPDAGLTAVCGFMFLRFLCPAILSPDSYGIMSAPSKEVRRALILISKVIQNLANGVKFGQKESYMQEMNVFIDENLPLINDYMDSISSKQDYPDYTPLCTLKDARKVELPKLHLKIVQNLEKITKTLYTYKQDAIIEDFIITLGELGDVDVDVVREKVAKKGLKINPFS